MTSFLPGYSEKGWSVCPSHMYSCSLISTDIVSRDQHLLWGHSSPFYILQCVSLDKRKVLLQNMMLTIHFPPLTQMNRFVVLRAASSNLSGQPKDNANPRRQLIKQPSQFVFQEEPGCISKGNANSLLIHLFVCRMIG